MFPDKILNIKEKIKEIIRERYAKMILGADFAVLVIRYGMGLFQADDFLLEVFLVLMLLGISLLAYIDFHDHRIPNQILLYMLILWVVLIGGYILVRPQEGIHILLMSLFGMIFSGMTFLICFLFTKGQIGGGDVKLSFIMGLYLTTERVFPVILYGTILCCFYSVVMLLRKKLTWKAQLPLVPFLHLGICLTFVLF